jgi:hypothetical protein
MRSIILGLVLSAACGCQATGSKVNYLLPVYESVLGDQPVSHAEYASEPVYRSQRLHALPTKIPVNVAPGLFTPSRSGQDRSMPSGGSTTALPASEVRPLPPVEAPKSEPKVTPPKQEEKREPQRRRGHSEPTGPVMFAMK